MLERVCAWVQCAWVQFDSAAARNPESVWSKFYAFFLTFDLSSLLLFLFLFFFLWASSMLGHSKLHVWLLSALWSELFFSFFSLSFFSFFLFSFFILQFNLNSMACDYTDHLSSSRGLLLCAAKGPCSVSCHSELVSDCTHLCLLHKTGYQYEGEWWWLSYTTISPLCCVKHAMNVKMSDEWWWLSYSAISPLCCMKHVMKMSDEWWWLSYSAISPLCCMKHVMKMSDEWWWLSYTTISPLCCMKHECEDEWWVMIAFIYHYLYTLLRETCYECEWWVMITFIYHYLSTLEQTHGAFVVCSSEWVTAASSGLFWISTEVAYLHHCWLLRDCAMCDCCHFSALCLHHTTMSHHFMQSHIRRVRACLAVVISTLDMMSVYHAQCSLS